MHKYDNTVRVYRVYSYHVSVTYMDVVFILIHVTPVCPGKVHVPSTI